VQTIVKTKPEIAAPDSRRRKVLVADDDAILREVMAERLGTLGWDVVPAENGEEAIVALADASPDLAIVDITMPRLDGFGVLGHIRQNPRTIDIPVIVCTNHEAREPVERAFRLGASSFVTKPINWPLFLHHAQFIMRSGETERALRLAEAEAQTASRTKSAMFQVLSHELKTPLAALIGLTDVMEKSLRERAGFDKLEELDHVIEAARQLSGVVSDIMLLSKAVSGKQHHQFAPALLSEILDDGLAGLKAKAAAKGIRLLVRPAPTDALVMCDGRLLAQAVFKLTDNAIKFSPDGSTVDLWAHVSPDGSAVLTVKDCGPGLSQHKLKECLKPFMQETMGYGRPVSGLGLGLSIAEAICEAHGGELAIQTAPGLGLLAAIVLPPSLLLNRQSAAAG
jgi:two-component system sensor histidine kinase/response regulator